MLNFISFGSGSSGNCYYLYTDKEGLLIDTGIGIRTLKKCFCNYGLKLSGVSGVLVTHDHADHVKSVGWVSNEYNVPVYATEKVHKGIVGNYCVRKKVPVQNRKVAEKGIPFDVGNFRIVPFEVPHDSSDNVGYRIEYGDIVFCLITDVGHITPEISKNISEANYLVIEANHDEEMLKCGPYPQYLKERVSGPTGHLCNRVCGETLLQSASPCLRHVWLCHLSQENNHPELARKTIEMILKGGGIVPGADFQLEVLKRRIPSEIYKL